MIEPLPLSGIRVLDCSRVLAGPFATMLLADLGADVIKLEPPAGDETRGWGPPWWGPAEDGRSAYFASVNRNKRSLVVDLHARAGREILDRLASTADLLMHNARPASASRLGLEARRLRADHPNLVVAAVGGFPGADAERPAYDLLAQAMSGFMAVTGEPNGRPMKAGVAVLDLLLGLEVAVGSLAAVFGRRRLDGHAARVDVSLLDASVTALANVLANHLATGDEPRRWGNEHPNIVPYQVFRALDGYLAIAVGNDAQFERLLAVLKLNPDPRYATNTGRLAHRTELIPWLSRAVGQLGRDALAANLQAADVPAGPVNSVGEALQGMDSASGGGWTQQIGGIRLAPDPILIDGRRLPVHRPPPWLGEHTDALLSELGHTRAQIAGLRAAKVVA